MGSSLGAQLHCPAFSACTRQRTFFITLIIDEDHPMVRASAFVGPMIQSGGAEAFPLCLKVLIIVLTDIFQRVLLFFRKFRSE